MEACSSDCSRVCAGAEKTTAAVEDRVEFAEVRHVSAGAAAVAVAVALVIVVDVDVAAERTESSEKPGCTNMVCSAAPAAIAEKVDVSVEAFIVPHATVLAEEACRRCSSVDRARRLATAVGVSGVPSAEKATAVGKGGTGVRRR